MKLYIMPLNIQSIPFLVLVQEAKKLGMVVDKEKIELAIEDIKKQNNVNDKILWIDKYISDKDINLYFSVADMVVLPYLESTQSGIIPIAYNYNKII